MFKKNDEIVSEPYIPIHETVELNDNGEYVLRVAQH
jgi:hypothetical protein